MSNPTVPAAAEGLPAFISTTPNPAALAALSMSELVDLRDGLNTVHQVIVGLICRPRYRDDEGSAFELPYNPAGVQLDHFHGLIEECVDAIDDAIRSRPDLSPTDADTRQWAMLVHASYHAEDLPALAAYLMAKAADYAAMPGTEMPAGAAKAKMGAQLGPTRQATDEATPAFLGYPAAYYRLETKINRVQKFAATLVAFNDSVFPNFEPRALHGVDVTALTCLADEIKVAIDELDEAWTEQWNASPDDVPVVSARGRGPVVGEVR